MKRLLLIIAFLFLAFLTRAQTKPTDAPDLDKIEIKEPDNTVTKIDNKVSKLDVSATEEKEIAPPGISGNNSLPGEFEPEFPGGIQEFYEYISKNIKIPASQYIKGQVIVKFVINSDGHLIEPKIVYGQTTNKMREEISRVLLASPVWKPGIQKNKAVRVGYTMPITF